MNAGRSHRPRLHGLPPLALALLALLAPSARADDLIPSAPLPSAGSAVYQAFTVEDALDRWMRRGADDLPSATIALDAWGGETVAALPSVQRQLQFVRGHLQALHGRAEATALATGLRALAAERGEGAAGAAADLVDATVAETAGLPARTGDLARAALAVLGPGCELPSVQVALPTPAAAAPAALPATSPPPLPPACDYRLTWRALDLMVTHETGRGAQALALAHAQAGHELAVRARDPWRQAHSTARLALARAAAGEPEAAVPLMRQAQLLAAELGDPELQARVWLLEGGLADLRGRPAEVAAAIAQALPLARRAGSPRLEALLLINLADVHTKAGRHVPALQAVEQALPIVRRQGDQRLEQAVLHNAALARIGLGRIDEARPDMDRSLELAQRDGASAEAALSLREFSQAMAKAGAVGEALELYHRERRLTDEANALNRQTALESLRTANDSERKDRDIELLSRDNALKAEALANHELTQRVAVLLTVAVALGFAVAGMLVWRLRETQRRLVASQAQLRVQSERDPLTQLANRRHFQAVMRQRPSGAGFGGALLMIDIDHFKQVNDRHGHAAGDAVLVEVARRLNDAVRGEDLVVRWGGEEFLVLARDVPVTQLEAMVQRVLQKVAQTPVSAGGSNATTADDDDGTVRRLPPGAPVRVTASVGYARFPMPPHQLVVSWEQALHLTDLALFRAKRQGRNRAVGVVALHAPDATALRRIEGDFDAAVADGRIGLHLSLGPRPTARPADRRRRPAGLPAV